MWESSAVELCSKLSEIILQTRLEVRPELFNNFQVVLGQVRNRKASPPPLEKFTELILPKQLYHVRSALLRQHPKTPLSLQTQIDLCLIHRGTGARTTAESWIIQIAQRHSIEKSGVRMLGDLFHEITVILYKLPLFSVYKKQRDMRSRYMLNWECYPSPRQPKSLVDLRGRDFVRRHNGQVAVQVTASYMPTLDLLWKPMPEPTELDRKGSMVHSDYGGERKVSIFEFHDPDLDFTFLSSEEQPPGKGEATSQEIVLNIENEHSGEWEMMFLTEDEEFLAANKGGLAELLQGEQLYME